MFIYGTCVPYALAHYTEESIKEAVFIVLWLLVYSQLW